MKLRNICAKSYMRSDSSCAARQCVKESDGPETAPSPCRMPWHTTSGLLLMLGKPSDNTTPPKRTKDFPTQGSRTQDHNHQRIRQPGNKTKQATKQLQLKVEWSKPSLSHSGSWSHMFRKELNCSTRPQVLVSKGEYVKTDKVHHNMLCIQYATFSPSIRTADVSHVYGPSIGLLGYQGWKFRFFSDYWCLCFLCLPIRIINLKMCYFSSDTAFDGRVDV